MRVMTRLEQPKARMQESELNLCPSFQHHSISHTGREEFISFGLNAKVIMVMLIVEKLMTPNGFLLPPAASALGCSLRNEETATKKPLETG